tara:strand:+ start:1929 stop:2612 length:684 start_codon:yes stop_codon:yes gene_type:complete
MAMTFLQLAARLRQEVCGAGTGPTAVTNQTGESKRIVDWIASADEEVQQEHDGWRFMVGNFTLNTVAADGSYAASDFVTPVTDLRQFREKTLKIYLLSAGVSGESRLTYMDYDQWEAAYNIGTQTSNRPTHFTVGNDMSLKLWPIPDAIYRVSGEYQKSVTTLSASSDTPNYPSEYHMLPVYRGMMKYGRYAGAMEVYSDGERMYRWMLRKMERTQLPRIAMAGALA